MALQAIHTKYLAPTSFNGARIKAKYNGGGIICQWRSELDVYGNHSHAAWALLSTLGWNLSSDYVGGSLPDGSYTFVATENAGAK